MIKKKKLLSKKQVLDYLIEKYDWLSNHTDVPHSTMLELQKDIGAVELSKDSKKINKIFREWEE